MEQSKIDRINALAKKAKTEGLTEAETAERKALREEYIAAYRKNLRTQAVVHVHLVFIQHKDAFFRL